jgi:hypothetical protein
VWQPTHTPRTRLWPPTAARPVPRAAPSRVPPRPACRTRGPRRPGPRRRPRAPASAPRAPVPRPARRINPWLFMITKEKHAYRMLFLRRNGITPIAAVLRAGEFLFLREFCAVIRMRRAAPAWQHGGMTWWTAGGGIGSIAARATEGLEQSGAPTRRLLAGNFTGFSQPTRYLMALCYFSSHFCSARNVGGPRGPRHERTTGILTVWAGAPRMTWTVS